MRRSTSLLVSSLVLSLSAACSSTNQSSKAAPDSKPAAHGPLDGKVFNVELVDPNGKKDPDQLTFDAASFESSACRPYGFKAAQYSGRAQGEDVTFESTAVAKNGGTNAWKGTVHGSAVKGTVTCTDPKGAAMHCTFEGKLASGADGKPQDKDRVTFQSGSFDSSSCRPFGFIRTGYTTTPDGDSMRFEATCTSADYPMNHWQGTVHGDKIEGTLKSGEAADGPVLKFTGHRVP